MAMEHPVCEARRLEGRCHRAQEEGRIHRRLGPGPQPGVNGADARRFVAVEQGGNDPHAVTVSARDLDPGRAAEQAQEILDLGGPGFGGAGRLDGPKREKSRSFDAGYIHGWADRCNGNGPCPHLHRRRECVLRPKTPGVPAQ